MKTGIAQIMSSKRAINLKEREEFNFYGLGDPVSPKSTSTKDPAPYKDLSNWKRLSEIIERDTPAFQVQLCFLPNLMLGNTYTHHQDLRNNY